jgi:hypothetical protein
VIEDGEYSSDTHNTPFGDVVTTGVANRFVSLKNVDSTTQEGGPEIAIPAGLERHCDPVKETETLEINLMRKAVIPLENKLSKRLLRLIKNRPTRTKDGETWAKVSPSFQSHFKHRHKCFSQGVHCCAGVPAQAFQLIVANFAHVEIITLRVGEIKTADAGGWAHGQAFS